MTLTRREFIKHKAAAAAAATAGIALPVSEVLAQAPASSDGVRWDKGVCRYCGTGCGGEEAQALAAAGVPFEVIPGISAAQGAAASAGMPLTHRDHARALVFATGHLQGVGDARTVDLDWPMLARPRQTVVIYMGLGALPVICAQLMQHGMPGDTPAATVERATCADERTIAGTLETLPALARVQGVRSPALIVIGEVVRLRDTLAMTNTATGAAVVNAAGA